MKNHILFYILFCICLSKLHSQNIEIYVSDGGDFQNPPWQILKSDEDGSNTTVYINTNLAWPQDILFLEDQNIVLISNFNSGRITKYDIETGNYIGNFATGIAGPTRMKIGPDNLLYVLQWNGNGRVRRYQLDGTYLGEFTNIGLGTSIGLDWDNDGNLYVSSYNQDLIRKYNTSGNFIENFITSNLVGPTNIVFDSNGNLIVLDYDGDSIKRFDINGNYLGIFISGLDQPEGIDFMSNGDILIGNGGTSAVKKYTNNGSYIEDIIPSGTQNLLLPNAVRIRDNSSLSIDGDLLESKFLTSNTGAKFFSSSSFNENIESVRIYNLLGILVNESKVSESLLWDASEAADGLYIIRVKLNDGRILQDKIIAQKNN